MAKTTAELTAELAEAREDIDQLLTRLDKQAKDFGVELEALRRDLNDVRAAGGGTNARTVEAGPVHPPEEGDEFERAHQDDRFQTVVVGSYPGSEVRSRVRPDLLPDPD